MTETTRGRSGSGGSTLSVHGGEEREKLAKSLTNPIVQTSTFVFDDLDDFESLKAGERSGFEYGRYGNPTVRAAERPLERRMRTNCANCGSTIS